MDGTAGCSIVRNGISTSTVGENIRERYRATIAAEDWDYVIIQHGPNHVEKVETYSYLPRLLGFIKDNLQSEKTRILYNMVWKYNDNIQQYNSTAYQYENIINITQNTVLINPEFSGCIPSATFRQNMVSSFLGDADISRDYGHMGLTLGRYALGLLWFKYLTGKSIDSVSFVPTADDVSEELKERYKEHTHLEITKADMLVVDEAIDNALKSPFAVTESVYKTAPVCD